MIGVNAVPIVGNTISGIYFGADLDLLISFITGGGNVRNLSQQLSTYESNGGDFGSGPLSNFWEVLIVEDYS